MADLHNSASTGSRIRRSEPCCHPARSASAYGPCQFPPLWTSVDLAMAFGVITSCRGLSLAIRLKPENRGFPWNRSWKPMSARVERCLAAAALATPRRSLRLYVGQGYKVRPERGANSFASIARSKLAIKVSKVSLHGWDRQANFARDSLGRPPSRQPTQDLHFPGGQAVGTRLGQ